MKVKFKKLRTCLVMVGNIIVSTLTGCVAGSGGVTPSNLTASQEKMLEQARFDEVAPSEQLDMIEDDKGPLDMYELKQAAPEAFAETLTYLNKEDIEEINDYIEYEEYEDKEESSVFEVNKSTNTKLNSIILGSNKTYVRCYGKPYYINKSGAKILLPYPTEVARVLEGSWKNWIPLPIQKFKILYGLSFYGHVWALNKNLKDFVKINIKLADKGEMGESHRTYYFEGTTLKELQDICVNTLNNQMKMMLKKHPEYRKRVPILEEAYTLNNIQFENIVVRGADNNMSYDHALLPFKVENAGNKFARMVSLGDSLSDTYSTNNMLLWKIPNRTTWMAGHFTNGWTWPEYAAEKLNVIPYNEAWGAAGAQSILLSSVIAGDTVWKTLVPGADKMGYYVPGFIPLKYTVYYPYPVEKIALTQFDFYKTNLSVPSQTQNMPENTLYTILIGGNDFVNYNKQPSEVIDGITVMLDNLVKNLNAKYIVIINLPEDVSNAPVFSKEKKSIKDVVTKKIKEYNNLLVALVAERNNLYISQGYPVEISLFDANATFNNIMASLSNYGFTNINETCLANPIVAGFVNTIFN